MYKPTLQEIDPLMVRAKRLWPHLGKRIDKAGAFLSAFDLRYSSGWLVASQARAETEYAVGVSGCQCLDYLSGKGNAGGRIFCKHSIAWGAYRQILLDHIEQLIDPLAQFNGAGIKRIKREEAVIIQDRAWLHGANYGAGGLLIKFRFDHARQRRTFADGDSMASFARWLESAQSAIQRQAEEKARRRMEPSRPLDEAFPVALTPEWQPDPVAVAVMAEIRA